ncbi:23S rRNA pseudouridine2605 synthase [Niastella yeongjuensis]|nr:23S rRNA pseudouridine2605 synthase [Niastella yeongjuensis]
MGNGDSGAKKKERIRQEKKKVRQETKEYFEKKKQEAREARSKGQAGGYQADRGRQEHSEKKADFKAQGARGKTQGGKSGNFKSKDESNTGYKKAAGYTGKKASTSPSNGGGREAFKPKTEGRTPEALGFKPKAGGKATKTVSRSHSSPSTGGGRGEASGNKPVLVKGKAQKTEAQPETDSQQAPKGSMPLNKFIAHSGICSRRDAVDLVKAGKVIVNGAKIVEPGHKVSDKDDIKVNGKKLFIRRNLVYILLNKPKDFITTTEDPQGRKTVMDILKNATEERVYPIGRLDRNTTGVLLLTNDGELAQKLSHPSYEIKKIYEVKLDKPLVKKDFETILGGITLEDGFVSPDSMAYADSKDKSVIGIEIHSGRNRIVRRIFEHMGYDVRNLDRVMYANLTKKNVDRGKWRFLTEKEVRLLKYLNASYTKNKNATRG